MRELAVGSIAPLLERVDSVYMLMWPGWSGELRSNRWHFGRRWARHKPVVMVQPDRLGRGPPVPEPERRIAGCTILHVGRSDVEDKSTYLEDSLVQAGQIASWMRSEGHAHPLLWFYNPHLVVPYALLPASLRVVHATENYFAFERLSAGFLDAYSNALGLSDAAVCVSRGIAADLAPRFPKTRLILSSNGCDYAEYAGAAPSNRLDDIRAAGFRDVAVYAGNVNDRIDFELLLQCAARQQQMGFMLFGPVARLPADDERRWRRLLARPNVRYCGPVLPAELPGIYAAADVGLIPYKSIPLVQQFGFPLKALEMTAAGLPVVSTYMRPLEEIADVIEMAPSAEGFLQHVAIVRRGALTAQRRQRMDEVCRARGYDHAFEQVVQRLDAIESPYVTRADALATSLPTGDWMAMLQHGAESPRRTLLRLAARRLGDTRVGRLYRRLRRRW